MISELDLDKLNEKIKNEPNSLRFTDDDTGLECFIRRSKGLMIYCGYVFIPDDVADKIKELEDDLENTIDVHGGITFSGHVEFHEQLQVFEKLEEKSEDTIYMVGFDCGHWDDFMPYTHEVRLGMGLMGFGQDPSNYKDIDFVKNECKKLAKQLHEVIRTLKR